MEYDYVSLRDDLLDYFGTATFSSFPMSMVDLSHVDRASNEQLLHIAMQNGFDLNKYIK